MVKKKLSYKELESQLKLYKSQWELANENVKKANFNMIDIINSSNILISKNKILTDKLQKTVDLQAQIDSLKYDNRVFVETIRVLRVAANVR